MTDSPDITEEAIRLTYLAAQRTKAEMLEEAEAEADRILVEARERADREYKERTEAAERDLAEATREAAALQAKADRLRHQLGEIAADALERLDEAEAD